MEIVLLVALAALAGWFFFIRDKKEEPKSSDAPYKIETPPEAKPDPEVKMVAQEVKVDPVVEPTPAPAPVETKAKTKTAKVKAEKAPSTKTKPAAKTAKTKTVKRTK